MSITVASSLSASPLTERDLSRLLGNATVFTFKAMFQMEKFVPRVRLSVGLPKPTLFFLEPSPPQIDRLTERVRRISFSRGPTKRDTVSKSFALIGGAGHHVVVDAPLGYNKGRTLTWAPGP